VREEQLLENLGNYWSPKNKGQLSLAKSEPKIGRAEMGILSLLGKGVRVYHKTKRGHQHPGASGDVRILFRRSASIRVRGDIRETPWDVWEGKRGDR